jgi:hypothetical protein
MLVAEINDETVLDMLVIADRYDATELWTCCVNYYYSMTIAVDEKEYEIVPAHVKMKLYSSSV